MASGGAEALFVDTNILVFANVTQAPLHHVALRTIQQYDAAGHERYTPGTTVLIEELATGEPRITPTTQIRRLTRERAEQLVAENREALEMLARDDDDVQGMPAATGS